MDTEKPKEDIYTHVRITRKHNERLKKVARKIADRTDADVSASAVVDEILEEGLSRRERKLGIATKSL